MYYADRVAVIRQSIDELQIPYRYKANSVLLKYEKTKNFNHSVFICSKPNRFVFTYYISFCKILF